MPTIRTSPNTGPRSSTASRGATAISISSSRCTCCAARSSPATDYNPRAVAGLAAAVADGNVRCHLATMARLGITYDLLTHESDILHLGFWQRAFEILRAAGAIRLEDEGKNTGCWVMSLAASPEFADMDDPDKILVRSNGTITYTAKDIAYQLWKLGLLLDGDGARHDFGYRDFADWKQPVPPSRCIYGTGPWLLVRTTSDTSETGRRAIRSAAADGSTTSSTSASPTRRKWSRRRFGCSATPRPPTTPSTSPTRWWL